MASPPKISILPESALSRHQINKKWWNEVTPVHAASEFYDVDGFLQGKSALDRLEIKGLGELTGKSVLHLQCHFGLSTLDIARRGANAVGVDLSDQSIRTAQNLAQRAGLETRFLCCDVFKLDQQFDQQFDIVFTSYGAITWLCDLKRWGEIIARFLKPGGRFFIVEIHPTAMLFEQQATELKICRDYFHDPDGLTFIGEADYADPTYRAQNSTLEWQWSMADIFAALTNSGLKITDFQEYPFSCFRQFPMMTEGGDKLWYLPKDQKQIPLLFSLSAIKLG